ncbi:MAG TPA: glycosyltransferase family 4 protein [Acidimicrobiales bacterium]|nr:glycosyltransferase family 4 protein [Acidimicrobiales bacterium]
MKLGLVVPRYGVDVVGGIEHWLRLLCEHLVAMKGWEVDVFTTGALSAATWADELAPGDSEIGGVTVHRRHSISGRDPRSGELSVVIGRGPTVIPDAVARRFVELVGPVCPDVLDDAAGSGCDLVAVTPYLFWPAVHATARLGRRVILHSAAHDEPELHLPIMRDVFASVGGFAYNSYGEQALVERTFPVAHLPASVIGATVVEGSGDPEVARAALGLAPGEPFVLCVGRVERAKGSHVLAELWRLYRQRRPGAPRLVLLGPVHEDLEGDDAVVVAGRQPEEVKWGALQGCAFVVTPSAWESFSLVVLEAWLAGAPVMVNRRCEATMEHCRRSGGGLWFFDYADFEAVADTLLADSALRELLVRNGRSYTRRVFNWGAIVDRYETLTQRILESSALPAAVPPA